MNSLTVPHGNENFIEQIWDLKAQTIRSDFGLLRLPLCYSPEDVEKAMQNYLPDTAWTPKPGTRGLDVVGLTGSNPDDLYADERLPQVEFGPGSVLLSIIPRPPRIHASPVFKALSPLWQKLDEFQIVKPKLSRLKPSHTLTSHIDGPGIVNLHLAVSTNEFSMVCVLGKLYHIPADGHLYALNASVPHHVFNFGTTERIHVVTIIRPKSFVQAPKFEPQVPLPLDLANSTRIVQHQLSHKLLEDGGEAFYHSLAADLRANNVKQFRFSVSQESIDDQSFLLLLGLISGLVMGGRRAIFLEPESPTDVLRATPETRCAFEFLERVSNSPIAGDDLRAGLKDFLGHVVPVV